MSRLRIPEPVSGGLLLSYKCNSSCRHCAYACSPTWKADWISASDAERILTQLAVMLRGKYANPDRIGVNYEIHFTGGEPFLRYDLLLKVTEMATRLGIPSTFVETNAYWCVDDEGTRRRLKELQGAGLKGILISANPFVLERVPFERTERGAVVGRQVFGGNAIVYQSYFFRQFQELRLRGTLSFEDYLRDAGHGLQHSELLPGGRISYALGHLFQKNPARRFFRASCRDELVRDWHIHFDNFCNFVPGYCGGISLGDARDLDAICRGIDLDEFPIIAALLSGMEELHMLGTESGYQELEEGYVSKCHLCVDIRKHLVNIGQFKELKPVEFYEHLED